MREADNRPRCLFVENHAREFFRDRLLLADLLREVGCDVHLAIPRADRSDPASFGSIPVHPFYLSRVSANPWSELRTMASLLRIYRELRPTLIHHIGLKVTLHGSAVARITSTPAIVNTLTGLGYVFTGNSMRTRILRRIVTTELRLSVRHQNQCVIFQNTADRNTLALYHVRFARTVLIKGSGVNLSVYTPRREPPEPVVVLMAARLLWSKGVAELVHAGQRLAARGIKARFVLVGEPDDNHPDAVPRKRLQEWHDSGQLEWLGWRDDVPALLGQSHIVCLPTSYGEGIPRILLEAAASQRAIVASDTPGCREVVRHGENGLLVQPGDVGALADAIALLIQNPALRIAMGARGRARVAAEFSVEQVVNRNLVEYASLLPSVPFPIRAFT